LTVYIAKCQGADKAIVLNIILIHHYLPQVYPIGSTLEPCLADGRFLNIFPKFVISLNNLVVFSLVQYKTYTPVEWSVMAI
jgi:hypothetical protein